MYNAIFTTIGKDNGSVFKYFFWFCQIDNDNKFYINERYARIGGSTLWFIWSYVSDCAHIM